MKLPEPYKCDYCAATKKDTNHWLLVQFTDAVGNDRFVMSSWDDSSADKPNVKHVCGRSCAAKAQSEFLDKLDGQKVSGLARTSQIDPESVLFPEKM